MALFKIEKMPDIVLLNASSVAYLQSLAIEDWSIPQLAIQLIVIRKNFNRKKKQRKHRAGQIDRQTYRLAGGIDQVQ